MNRLSTPNGSAFASAWLPVVALISSASTPAIAQVAQPDQQDVSAVTSNKQQSASRWTLGAGVAEMPRFYGSEDYQTQPAPLIDVQLGRFFARTGEGIGFNVLTGNRFTAGVSLNWIQGYDADDVPIGINEVDDALGARVFVSARLKGAIATLAATQAVTESDRGMLVNASFAYPIRATSRLMISPSLGATWGNEKYLNGYFGVDAPESAASGFNFYSPRGNGFRDVSLRVGVAYRITDKVTAVGSFGVTHLLDKAADSPLVERTTQPIGLVGLTYSFGR